MNKLTRSLLALSLMSPTMAAAQEPNFGRALALSGSELFVGQPVNWYGPGTVYVYQRDRAGAWAERSRLFAPDSTRLDDFGRALAVDGNTLIVTAPRKRKGSGVAYTFTRSSPAAAWRQTSVIEPPASGDHSDFGAAIELNGDELLIGSPAVDRTGVVYHYHRQGTAWQLLHTIRPPDAPLMGGFGRAIARAGDVLFVGAPAADTSRGRVYTFNRQANGTWHGVRVDVGTRPQRAGTGASILMDANRAYVGVPGAGAVVVLARDEKGAWTHTAELLAPDTVRGAQFGHAIEKVGDELWVSAPFFNEGNGRVYRFRSENAGWKFGATLDADSADGTKWPFSFGYAIATHGDRAVVSMPQRDFGEGRVLALTRERGAWQPRQLLEGQIYAIGRGLATGQRCENGRMGDFPCASIEMVAHIPNSALGGERGVWLNDVWGWTDPATNKEYALVARRDGAAFVDVTDPARPRLIGSLPRTSGSPPSVWRDIKTIGHYAFLVADGAKAHGMQVFDLRRLRTVADTPTVFRPDTTYHNVHSAHNVVADTMSHFVYIVGANGGGETCGGGLHMVNVRDALRPVFVGCYNDRLGSNNRGYTHDAQCLTYNGPDTRFRGREICVGSNETEINIADVTDKAKPVTLGRNSYPNVGYAHQGWFDEEQRYFYMNDETD
ncbi:MAG TPA: choice-of-anchor B family protein, partial [Longimicrobiales bacterium]